MCIPFCRLCWNSQDCGLYQVKQPGLPLTFNMAANWYKCQRMCHTEKPVVIIVWDLVHKLKVKYNTLKKYFAMITQYCGFQNYVRVFLSVRWCFIELVWWLKSKISSSFCVRNQNFTTGFQSLEILHQFTVTQLRQLYMLTYISNKVYI